MRYAGLVKNDIVDGDDGIAVALYFKVVHIIVKDAIIQKLGILMVE